jgi:hypothetical protein
MRFLSVTLSSFLLLLLPLVSSQRYVDNVFKYTGCNTDCSNSKCPSGHRVYTDWAQLGVTDSYGESYSFCGWAWQERCKCNACNYGYFDSLVECTACPIGSYKNVVGEGNCQPCSSGSVSSAASRSCETCVAGKRAFSSSGGLSVCEPCDA